MNQHKDYIRDKIEDMGKDGVKLVIHQGRVTFDIDCPVAGHVKWHQFIHENNSELMPFLLEQSKAHLWLQKNGFVDD